MLIFDGHCDILSKINDPEELVKNRFHWDLTRAGRYGAFIQVLASYADDTFRKDPPAIMNNQIEKAIRFEALHPDRLKILKARSDLQKIRPGGIYGILSAEGGEILKGDIEELDRLFKKGLRVMNLSWNYDNEVCDSVAGRRTHHGLSLFGRKVVDRMQQLGMLIDISHASDETFFDVMALIKIPAAATHSNCRALCNHPRNLTDAQIIRISGSGGVIGINLYSPFLSGSGKAGIKDILNHIEHMAGLAGTDHIGLGCDFDGGEPLPEGIDGVESIYKILDALAGVNYPQKSIDQIAGGNFLSLFTQVLN